MGNAADALFPLILCDQGLYQVFALLQLSRLLMNLERSGNDNDIFHKSLIYLLAMNNVKCIWLPFPFG